MFDNLTKNVSKPTQRAQRSTSVEIPRTVAFVQALANNPVASGGPIRLSYAALASAAEALGEHEATGMSPGQRGAALLAGLPIELQPRICNAKGGYRKGISWEGVDANVKALRNQGYLRPEGVAPFVTAFIKATAKTEEPVTQEEGEPTEE